MGRTSNSFSAQGKHLTSIDTLRFQMRFVRLHVCLHVQIARSMRDRDLPRPAIALYRYLAPISHVISSDLALNLVLHRIWLIDDCFDGDCVLPRVNIA